MLVRRVEYRVLEDRAQSIESRQAVGPTELSMNDMTADGQSRTVLTACLGRNHKWREVRTIGVAGGGPVILMQVPAACAAQSLLERAPVEL